MTTDLNVVIAVRGFSYSGSFLAQVKLIESNVLVYS